MHGTNTITKTSVAHRTATVGERGLSLPYVDTETANCKVAAGCEYLRGVKAELLISLSPLVVVGKLRSLVTLVSLHAEGARFRSR